jgi:hypothetical protein
MVRKALFAIVVIAGMGAAGSVAAQQTQQQLAQQLQQEVMTPVEGIALVRQINTIMGRLYVRNNAQMTLRDAVMDDTFTRAERFELTNANTGVYKRYRLTITHITGDKESYQLSLVPFTGCGPSWFSNETGLIFSGTCVQ